MNKNIPASFRDPSGFLFRYKGTLLRQVNTLYKENYDLLMGSGLYDELVEKGLLIKHEEVKGVLQKKKGIYKVIKPEKIPFISYPYEWCFSQLKDAALLTLKIQKTALEYGMTLKDASAFNIQFHNGQPVFIDSLSFEKYSEGKPWVAYRQFCQHFFIPLFLVSRKDLRFGTLSRVFLDGIPLDLAGKLLDKRSLINPSFFVHIYLHSKTQKYFQDKKVKVGGIRVNKASTLSLIEGLEKAVGKIVLKKVSTQWGNYYQRTNYSKKAFSEKLKLVGEYISAAGPVKSIWDLGANTGEFSRLASQKGIYTVSFDIDPLAVERNYSFQKKRSEKFILPLVVDITNPSPALGWENKERDSLIERGPADCVLALALIHHLAISDNLPFDEIAGFFGRICKFLIIEFVPKDDSNVQKLLLNREDVFDKYSQTNFETVFAGYFRIEKGKDIKGSKRRLYLMRKK